MNSAQTLDGIVPTTEERAGDLAGLSNALGQPVIIYNPVTGAAYAGNRVPVDPVAAALLKLYPLPNLTGASQFNYQAQVLNQLHKDGVDLSLFKQIKHVGLHHWILRARQYALR